MKKKTILKAKSLQYRDRQRKKLKRGSNQDSIDVDADNETNKRGRKGKVVYGVNNQKYYATDANMKDIETLKHAAKLDSFEEREDILKSHRAPLMKLVRFYLLSCFKFSDGLLFTPGVAQSLFQNRAMHC